MLRKGVKCSVTVSEECGGRKSGWSGKHARMGQVFSDEEEMQILEFIKDHPAFFVGLTLTN